MFTILGIWCGTDDKAMVEKNYKERIGNLKTILNIWRQRNLSLKGKITMLWAIALPQLIFVCSSLFTPPWVIREVDGLFFNFLSANKKHHVKKETIIADSRMGD